MAREGRARIDDGDVVAEELRHRRQRLADMHRAGDDEPRRRHVHGEEDLALRRLLHAALAAADVLFEQVLERVARDVGGLDQPLRAARQIGDDDGGAARGAFGIEGLRGCRASWRSCDCVPTGGYRSASRIRRFSTIDRGWCRRRRARPSRRSRRRRRIRASCGLPLSITSSASVTTAPSTQPPETEPRNCPGRRSTRLTSRIRPPRRAFQRLDHARERRLAARPSPSRQSSRSRPSEEIALVVDDEVRADRPRRRAPGLDHRGERDAAPGLAPVLGGFEDVFVAASIHDSVLACR